MLVVCARACGRAPVWLVERAGYRQCCARLDVRALTQGDAQGGVGSARLHGGRSGSRAGEKRSLPAAAGQSPTDRGTLRQTTRNGRARGLRWNGTWDI
ncbi:unnamed protein product [Lampetra planeri]